MTATTGRNLVDPSRDLDDAVAKCFWAEQFQRYLAKRNLHDDVAALRFLLFTQPISDNNNKRRLKSSNGDADSLKAAAEHFFGPDSTCQVCLSNPELAESILAEAAKSPVDVSALRALLARARADPEVWQAGLEPRFMRFLADESENTVAPVACILSII